MNRNLITISCCILLSTNLAAQSKLGIENYYYPGTPGSNGVVPVVHFETNHAWRAELRYNYEDAATISLYAGKTFSSGKSLEWSISPMIGFSTGVFTGVSLATNIEAEWKNLYLSSQNQYSKSTKTGCDNFLFSWSEAGYNFSEAIFAGVAIQYTRSAGHNNLEPGFVGGFSIGNMTVPLYAFSPFGSGRYFVAGVIYECHFKKKKGPPARKTLL